MVRYVIYSRSHSNQVAYAAPVGSTYVLSCVFLRKNTCDSWHVLGPKRQTSLIQVIAWATSCKYLILFKPCVPGTYWYHIDTDVFFSVAHQFLTICVSHVSLLYSLFIWNHCVSKVPICPVFTPRTSRDPQPGPASPCMACKWSISHSSNEAVHLRLSLAA